MLECKMYARLSKPRLSTLKQLMTCMNTLVNFFFISFCSFLVPSCHLPSESNLCGLADTEIRPSTLVLLHLSPPSVALGCFRIVACVQHNFPRTYTHRHTHRVLYITSSKGPLCNVLLSWLSHSPGDHGKDDQRKNWHIQMWKLQAGSHSMVQLGLVEGCWQASLLGVMIMICSAT